MNETMIGIYEIAELANVSASAVANWRKRFSDFPTPLVELKSGPVVSQKIRSPSFGWPGRNSTDSVEVELFSRPACK